MNYRVRVIGFCSCDDHRRQKRIMDASLDPVEAGAELGRLGLDAHLSAQRSNGLRAMVKRIRDSAAAAVA